MNRNLGAAKAAKQDEFYTQYVDIQKEVEAYLEFDPDTFCGKVVYCNCDDPFESNFFKYFAVNFNKLGLKKLITTSYDGSPIAGQGTLFPEYNEGNGKRQKPKALGNPRSKVPFPPRALCDKGRIPHLVVPQICALCGEVWPVYYMDSDWSSRSFRAKFCAKNASTGWSDCFQTGGKT